MKTYQITVNEREAEILKENVDAYAHEVDLALRDGNFREGKSKEDAIEVLHTFQKVSKQLPNKVEE